MVRSWRNFAPRLAFAWFCSGCVGPNGASSLTEGPPALPHGTVFDRIVAHTYVGSREVGVFLAEALRQQDCRPGCATVRVVTPAGQVLACATVCGQPRDAASSPLHRDARELLTWCLRSPNQWEKPALMVSADAAGTVVLASAAWMPVEGAGSAGPLTCYPLRFPRVEPFLYLHVGGLPAHDRDRLAGKAITLYFHAIRQQANAAAASASH